MLKMKEVDRDSPEGQKIMKQIYGLREDVYGVLGWIVNPKSAHLIKDEFDDIPHTTHFAIFEEGKIVGAHRMTNYSSDFKLPFLKEGIDHSIFKINPELVSEANRLLLKQDKKYPGCAKQLLFNTTNYELENSSKAIVSIGDDEHIDFFEFMGYKPINKKIYGILDNYKGKKVIRKGTPIVATSATLNKRLDLDRYNINREIVVIKNERK